MSDTGTLQHLRKQAADLYQAGRPAEAAAAHRKILAIAPADFESNHMLGALLLKAGQFEEGLALVEVALSNDPRQPQAWLHRGLALQNLCRAADAAASYERALQLRPDYPEALYNLGLVLRAQGRTAEAMDLFNRFIALHPDHPGAYFNRGNLLFDRRDFAAAVADFETTLGQAPDYADAWLHRGTALTPLGRLEEALESFDRVEALSPNRPEVRYNRGTVLQALGRDAEAMAAYDSALAIAPDLPAAWNNRGSLLQRAGRMDEALASYDRAIAANPRHTESWVNRGVIQAEHRKFAAAMESYDRAIGLNPKFADAWYNRGNVLRDMWRLDDALKSFERALAIKPRHAEALCNHAGVLLIMKRFGEAMAELRRLAVIAPDHKYLLGALVISARELCDWQTLDELWPHFEAAVTSGRSIVPPFVALGYRDDPVLARAAASHYLHDILPVMPATKRPNPASGPKIRLAYICAEFHAHATAHLMADLFERHDRTRFEVTGISFGADDGSDMRKRLIAAFDRFEDVRTLSDAEVAARLRVLNIDIAIDLKGYTQGARIGIFAHRAAPVQVSYLGYPGTLAADFIDYVIADKIVLPLDQQALYNERIVHLPDCYQPNDPARPLPAAPSRAEAGLPEEGFVFCCFNNHWKIARPVFDIWMRLLASAPGSVLWLMDGGGRPALVREAQQRGIDAARLIFAPMANQYEHMARHRLADLTLDTLPYNAHTTASDALWAGVPVVTAKGAAFAGRVGASLLTAAGLPELVTENLDAYEALALALARDPQRLSALRERLNANRQTAPLFDAERFARAIEAAYTGIMETARRP